MASESQIERITDGHFWWISILIALTACLIDATGWVIEKSTHIGIQSQLDLKRCDGGSETTEKAELQYLSSWKWWFGFITHISGTALFSSSLAFAEASLIMPLQSATLAFNAIFAWKFLGEKLNKKQVFGTILIVIGCAFAVMAGPKAQQASYTADELEYLFRQSDFLVFVVFIMFVAIIDYLLSKYYLTNPTLLLISYVFKAALFASWNLLFIKCFIEIIISSSDSKHNFRENGKNWIPYALFFLICFSKITSEYFREEALKKYKGNFVGSIYTMFFIVGVILFASIYFNEFESQQAGSSFAFAFCVLISFIGVLMLTIGDKDGVNTKYLHLIGDKSLVSPITSQTKHAIEIYNSTTKNGDGNNTNNHSLRKGSEPPLKEEKLMTDFNLNPK